MTQNGFVLELLPDSMATVAIRRGTACGGNCGSCEACLYDSTACVTARNMIGAVSGDPVIIESSTSTVIWAAVAAYILPIVFLIAGYVVGMIAGFTELLCILTAFSACILYAVIIKRVQKSKKNIEYTIIGYFMQGDRK